jgi:4-hydroxyphenylpyruvate dioxygenase
VTSRERDSERTGPRLVEEQLPLPSNPLGIRGVEFIEYATREPLALGALLRKMGFLEVARHRSREVLLFRQGGMNVIVNAHGDAVREAAHGDAPAISALAFRVRDAAYAHRRALELGAWDMPTRAAEMELSIPGIHGAGDSLIYFVDRVDAFSIYDIDFIWTPGAARDPPAIFGLHWFGVVQSVFADRSDDWIDFYTALLGFERLDASHFVGVLPKGRLLRSPGGYFYLQLVEPPPGADFVEWDEQLLRVGLGTPDVQAAVHGLVERGVFFVDREPLRPTPGGALTQIYMGSFCFELVHSEGGAARHPTAGTGATG